MEKCGGRETACTEKVYRQHAQYRYNIGDDVFEGTYYENKCLFYCPNAYFSDASLRAPEPVAGPSRNDAIFREVDPKVGSIYCLIQYAIQDADI